MRKKEPKEELRKALEAFNRDLKENPPPPPDPKTEAARKRTLARLRGELKGILADFKQSQAGASKPEEQPLPHLDLMVLSAVCLLRGKGDSLSITDKTDQFTSAKVRYSEVTDAMTRLNRRRLISSPSVKLAAKEDFDFEPFTITAAGKAVLSQAKAEAQRWIKALKNCR